MHRDQAAAGHGRRLTGRSVVMSSFLLAIPFAVAAACVYGTSIVVQHRSASEQSGGEASARGCFGCCAIRSG